MKQRIKSAFRPAVVAVLIVALLGLLIGVAAVTVNEIFMSRGDVNGDGAVDSADVTYLEGILDGTYADNGKADVDGNAVVDSRDVTFLTGLIAGNLPATDDLMDHVVSYEMTTEDLGETECDYGALMQTAVVRGDSNFALKTWANAYAGRYTVDLHFDAAQDWSAYNALSLDTLFENEPDSRWLYVRLISGDNNKVSYGLGMEYPEGWNTVHIDLDNFGADLTNVRGIQFTYDYADEARFDGKTMHAVYVDNVYAGNYDGADLIGLPDLGKLWDLENNPVTLAIDGTYKNDTRNHSYMKESANGVLGSKALQFGIASNAGHDITNTITFNPSEYGLDNGIKVKATDNIFWFWVDTDYVSDQYLQLQINDLTMANDTAASIYTIQKNASGKPAIVEVTFGGKDSVAGLDLKTHSKDSNMSIIKLYDGFSGWIGVPVSLYTNTDGDLLLPGANVETFSLMVRQKTDGNLDNQTIFDRIYIDEFWLTEANTMPALSDAALLYTGDRTAVSLQNFDEKAVGKAGGSTQGSTSSYSTVTNLVQTNIGIDGTNGVVHKQTSNAYAQTQYFALQQANSHFTNIGTFENETDTMWFWIDSDLSSDRIMHLQMNSTYPWAGTDYFVYTIVNNNGKPEIEVRNYVGNQENASDMCPVRFNWTGSSNSQSRIFIPAGWCGWIGVPEGVMKSAIGEISTIQIRFVPKAKTDIILDEVVNIDEFWMTEGGKMPDLTDAQLLYRGDSTPQTADILLDVSSAATGSMIGAAYHTETASNGQASNVNTFAIVAEKGYNNTNAIGLGMTSNNTAGDYTNRHTIDLTNSAAASAFNIGTRTELSADAMLWFFVNGMNLSNDARLNVLVNGEKNLGGVYYTVGHNAAGYQAKGPVALSSTETNNTDTVNKGTEGNIPVSAGYTGWVGIPLASFGETGVTQVDSIQFHLKRSGDKTADLAAGDAIYLSWFHIGNTVDGTWEIPDQTRNQVLWDFEDHKDKIYALSTRSGRNSSILEDASGYGVSKSVALKYSLDSADSLTNTGDTVMDNSITQTHTVYFNDYGVANFALEREDSIFWFWVDSAMSTSQRLILQPQGADIIRQTDTYIYTIVSENGTPTMKKVAYRADTDGADVDGVDGLDLINANPKTEGSTIAHIRLGADWSGWIGIPGTMFDASKIRTGGQISYFNIMLRQYEPADGNIGDQNKGDAVYIDEFWLTDSSSMPKLSNSALLYTGSATAFDGTSAPVLLFNNGATDSSFSSQSYVTDNTTDDTTSTLTLTDGYGDAGKSAMTVKVNSAGVVSDWWIVDLTNMPSTYATLNTNTFSSILNDASASDIMLWIWLDGSQLTKNARLSIGFSGTNYTFGDQYWIDMYGNVNSLDLGANSTGAGVAGDSDRGRITIEAGVSGWVGIPLSKIGSGTVTSLTNIRFCLSGGIDRDSSNAAVTLAAGDTLSIGDIWVSKKVDGSWVVPKPVLDSLVNEEYYTADDYLADPTLFVPSWADSWTPPAELLDWEEKFTAFYTPRGRVMSVGHRGDRNNLYPEGSIEGYLSVIKAGIDIIEVDVAKTKDGKLVALHLTGDNADEISTTNTNLGILRASGMDGNLPSSNKISDWTLAQLRQLRLMKGGTVTDYVVATVEDVFKVAKGNVFVSLDKFSNFNWDSDILPLIKSTGTYEHVLLSNSYAENYGYSYVVTRINELVSLGARKAGVMSEPWSTKVSTVVSNINSYGLPKILRLHEFGDGYYTNQSGENEYQAAKSYVSSYRIYFETLNGDRDNETVWQEIVDYGGNIIMSNQHPYDLIKFIANMYYPEES